MSGRSVVITGGAGGIGAALAVRFASGGDRVAVLDLDLAAAEAVAASLAEAGATALALACDVTDEGDCIRCIEEVIAQWGGVDVLINNAGISHHSDFAETSSDVFRRVFEVNLFGTANCTRAALASLQQRRGSVVAISSVAGFAPLLRRSAYAASKHALHGLFDSLREELHNDDVAVLLVCPSFVDTPIDRHALAGDGSTNESTKPVTGRLLTPEEVAEATFGAVAKRRKQRIHISGLSLASWWLSRLSPRAFAAAMRRKQAE